MDICIFHTPPWQQVVSANRRGMNLNLFQSNLQAVNIFVKEEKYKIKKINQLIDFY